jgi:cell division protein FtsQ
MDGGGRIPQPLTRSGQSEPAALAQAPPRRVRASRRAAARASRVSVHTGLRGAVERVVFRYGPTLLNFDLPRGAGMVAALLIMLAGAGYGAVRGGHLAEVIAAVKDVRDMSANAAGFRIASIALDGHRQLSREEILATAGVTGRTSLLFLDAAAARELLKTNPWIADATVLKLYPDRLQITVRERTPYALWQKDGRVSVVAADGTVLEPYVAAHLTTLPLVVGRGAGVRAKEFLDLLDRYGAVRDVVRASVLVAERRWNLQLRNGTTVRLPETEVAAALDTLVALDRDNRLLARDVTVIDLRLPDRVTVRLSDAAAQARENALKDKAQKKKGGAV